MRSLIRMFPLLGLLAGPTACGGPAQAPLPRVAQVDVPRFMGDWYVIAHIPSWPERDAVDAVESYALRPDGRIQTTFTYRRKDFAAPLKTMRPIGSVDEGGGGALWHMQFVWPIRAEYVISWLDADYQQTIVARSKRDYVWFMARTPQVSEADYQQAVARIAALGYDVGKLRRVPQSMRAATAPRPPGP